MDKIPKNGGSVVKISGGSVSAARRLPAAVAVAPGRCCGFSVSGFSVFCLAGD
jgi:hypothetical protein